MSFKSIFITYLFLLPFLGISQLSDQQKDQLREALSERINEQRVKKRLDPLIFNDTLRRSAQQHSEYMAKTNLLTHNQRSRDFSSPKKRVEAIAGDDFELVGENILYVYVEDFTLTDEDIEKIADEMFELWKDSRLHYQNMMSRDYQYADLGFESNPKKERIFATQVFGSK